MAKRSVTLYDTVTTDAFSNVVGQTGYIVDGLSLASGMRVIFAADTDPIVKNKIYDVDFVTAGDSTQVIVFIEFGTANQGKTFYYDGTTESWTVAQQKTGVNQQPLFGMWDNNHVSFADTTTYPNSSFTGAKVFSYATSDTATVDTVLGIRVKYNTINNVGDIVFESDHTSLSPTKWDQVQRPRTWPRGTYTTPQAGPRTIQGVPGSRGPTRVDSV